MDRTENAVPMSGRSLPRRDLLRAGIWAGLGLTGLTALACNQSRPAPTSSSQPAGGISTTTAAKTGGTFVFAEASKIISLDPHKAVQGLERAIIGEVYNGLLRYKAPPSAEPNTVMEGDLAESWKQIDDTTYEFKLRQGIKFHNVAPVNGRELVADDVKWNFERVSSKKPGFGFQTLYPVESAAVVDKYTARVKTTQPFAPFLGYVAFPYANIAPAELGPAYNDDITQAAVGTGPFILRKFDPDNEAVLEKNPEYFRKGMPYLDSIRLRILPDKTAAFNAFRGGQLDCTPILIPYQITIDQAEILKRQAPQSTVLLVQGLPWQSVRFNTAVKPFDDRRVRQAFSLLTDRDALISKYYAGQAKIIGPLPSELKAWALPEATLRAHLLYKRDVAKAKQLLSDAGVTGTLKVRTPIGVTNTDMINILGQQWADGGIELDYKITADAAASYAGMERGDFDILLFSHSGFQDPDDYFSTHVASDGPRNYGKFSNKEIDDLILRQRKTIDEAERKKIVNDLQMKLLDESPFLYLTSVPMPVAIQNYVKNFWINPIVYGANRYWESLWLDK